MPKSQVQQFEKLRLFLDFLLLFYICLFLINVHHLSHFMFVIKFGQVMLGVDRLDMIKGIPQKILAFEKFLEENSNWRDKVVLLQIAVPTRTDVPECMLLL